jgi:hypothetical protein
MHQSEGLPRPILSLIERPYPLLGLKSSDVV